MHKFFLAAISMLLLVTGQGRAESLSTERPMTGQADRWFEVIDGFRIGPTMVYENTFDDAASVEDWVLEGDAKITVADGRMHMANVHRRDGLVEANFVHWCPVLFPEDFAATWTFSPKREPGLAITIFGAAGPDGEDLFDPQLPERRGRFSDYHRGIRNMWISYFRHIPTPKPWSICHVRRNPGLHSIAKGPDPIGTIEHGADQIDIQMWLIKHGPELRFYMRKGEERLKILEWTDTSEDQNIMVGAGRIGFRQMAPLIAAYDDLRVFEVDRWDKPVTAWTGKATADPVALTAGAFRINCGADQAYTDAHDHLWHADQVLSHGRSWGAIDAGGGVVGRHTLRETHPDAPLLQSEHPDVYLSERYGLAGYLIGVPDGRYDLRLHFAETYQGIKQAGQRVFAVKVNGREVERQLDPYARGGGHHRPVVITVEDVLPQAGRIRIELQSHREAPQVNAIELIQR